MHKLNFGCGSRIADGWLNIDFDPGPGVRRVNLLAGFPYPDSSFDVVYSSHTLEHFSREHARFLIRESSRILKPGGILRIVVPDLESSCREYLRILGLDDADPAKQRDYGWIMLEMLDQLVRLKPNGDMGAFIRAAMERSDDELVKYILSRTQNHPPDAGENSARSFWQQLGRITPHNLKTKLLRRYLALLRLLVPKGIRGEVFVETRFGERHKWMYDRYGLKLLFESFGLKNISILDHRTSAIPGFEKDLLDQNEDGTPYKNVSVYCEGIK